MAKLAEGGDSAAGNSGRHEHKHAGHFKSRAARAKAARAKRRRARDFAAEAPPERQMTNMERIHNLNRQNIIKDLIQKAEAHAERKMSPALIKEAEELMASFESIENSIEAELEKFRNGTYSTSRPEEYAAAADRVRFAMYLVDKIREMHARVMKRDSESLLGVFILAAKGIQNMLSGNYFTKSGWQLMAPGDFGYLDLRVEPPFVACAQASGVELLPINKNIYLKEFLGRIGAH